MRKFKIVLILIASVLLVSSCSSTKKINNIDQSFTDYVILNKHAKEYRVQNGMPTEVAWDNLTSESFPGLRLINWLNTKSNNEEVK